MMHSVYVVMPVRGRKEQSVDAMRRLIGTASYAATYLAVAGLEDYDTVTAVGQVAGCASVVVNAPVASYWQGLKRATDALPDNALIATVANDVLPCINWLTNAVDHYNADSDNIVGFNGDGYDDKHACHFLISMKRVRSYGGWPVWYYHNFGDTEFVTRARQVGKFVKPPYAILFHNHPAVSRARPDDVYELGQQRFHLDKQLFELRKDSQWREDLTSLPKYSYIR